MKLAAVALWLAIGHAVGLALFWGLVNVPESNAWMLSLSAALVGMLVGLLSTLYTSTALWLQGTTSFVAALRAAVRSWTPALVGTLVGGGLWWVGRMAAHTLAAHAGEIDAWIIATFNRTQTAQLHDALRTLATFVQVVLAPSVGTTAFCVTLFDGPSTLRSWTWVGRAVSIRALSQTTFAVFILMWVPWQLAYWRPTILPPNALELVFAAVKLGGLFLFATLGVLVVLLAGVRAAQSRVDERAHL